MKLRKTFDKMYTTSNARITNVELGLNFTVWLKGNTGEDEVNLFVTGECIQSFCSLVGVSVASDAVGRYVRALYTEELGRSFRVMGLAHIVNNTAMIFCDYERHEELVPEISVPETSEPKELHEWPPIAAFDSAAAAYNLVFVKATKVAGHSVQEAHYVACESLRAGLSEGDGDDGDDDDDGDVTEKETIFVMASVGPPPGLPWVLQRHAGMWTLFPSKGDADLALAQRVAPELVDWLVDEAKLACRKELP